MPVETPTCGAFGGAAVRFAFLVPNSLLREIKQLALDRDTTVSDLVRAWIDTGLANGFDDQQPRSMRFDGPMKQYPINVSPAVRAAIQHRCEASDLSGAQLMRRWMVCGLRRDRGAEVRTPA